MENAANNCGCSRRAFLSDMGLGFTGLALGAMLAEEGRLKADAPEVKSSLHFPPKAKSVVWIFLSGGYSHIETFDPKPALNEFAGKTFDKTPFESIADDVDDVSHALLSHVGEQVQEPGCPFRAEPLLQGLRHPPCVHENIPSRRRPTSRRRWHRRRGIASVRSVRRVQRQKGSVRGRPSLESGSVRPQRGQRIDPAGATGR